MNDILAWGLEVVRAVQTIANPTLTLAMKAVTYLGSEYFYIIMLPIIFWTVDRRKGARLALVFLVSAFVNAWLKDLWAQPRPFAFDAALGMMAEPTYGLPSAHAQGTLVFWGLVATLFKRPWGIAAAVILPLIVGFSRVYLGVHFPTDVFVGWGLGLLFVTGDALLGDRLEKVLSILSTRWRLIIIAVLAFFMNALYRGDVSLAGAFLGAGFGFVWASESARFSEGGGAGMRALRIFLGLAVTVLVYGLPKLVAPKAGEVFYDLVRFMTMGFVGLWVSYGAPWVFLRLRLAERPEEEGKAIDG